MKVSEAMEMGSKMVIPIAGSRRQDYGNGTPIRACAIGMAEEAVGYSRSMESTWPWTTRLKIDLPCECTGSMMGSGCFPQNHGDGKNINFLSGLVHLFNYHVMTKKDWTMKKLLKWVECLEDHNPELVKDQG